MKKRLRATAWLLAVILLLGTLFACGAEPPSAEVESEPVESGGEGSGEVSDPEGTEGATDAEVATVTLGKESRSLFSVVLPKDALEIERQMAVRIATAIEKFTDDEVEITDEAIHPYKENAYEILIGRVSYPEAESALQELSRDEYGIRYVGRKLLVLGHVTATVLKAGELLLEEIDIWGSYEEKSVELPIRESWTKEETRMLLNYPDCKYGTRQIDIDNQNDTVMLSYTDVSGEQFLAYAEEVAASGYRLWQENQIGENLFRTYRSEEGEICLSYYPSKDNTLHIFTDRFTSTAPIPEAETYEKVTEVTLYNISFDYSQKSIPDGYGMCYVIALEDGRFVVLDGGSGVSKGSLAHDRLYRCLEENNKRPDGRIVIAAWFISHAHEDHYGAVESFVAKYRNDVTIESMVANPHNPAMSDGTKHWMLSTLPVLLMQTRATLIKPHTGQILTFCNAEFEVLFTHENLYPSLVKDLNNTSTVIRMRQNGHTALFSGDACSAVCRDMIALYGEDLKSDIFQINHHGHSGGTWEFYDLVTHEETYVLWTCPEEFFYYRTLGYYVDGKSIVDKAMLTPNRELALKVGFERNFYAEGIVEAFTFPEDGPIAVSEERDVTKDPTTYQIP